MDNKDIIDKLFDELKDNGLDKPASELEWDLRFRKALESYEDKMFNPYSDL